MNNQPAPKSAIDKANLDFLIGYIKMHTGISLNETKEYFIESRLESILREFYIPNFAELMSKLKANTTPKLQQAVINAITVNETSFFRDSKPFENLTKIIIPAIIAAGRKNIRIWSAACSSGQEPYSIAISIMESMAAFPGLSYEIFATDIASHILQKAQDGVYTQFEIQRGMPIKLLLKYFAKTGDQWVVKPDLKQNIKYQQLNLNSGNFSTFGKFDIIFCRNVLIYFDASNKTAIINNFADCLNKPGYLILGGGESIIGVTDKFSIHDANPGIYIPKA
jgi:chemotaxis protein methyltransferase CheR